MGPSTRPHIAAAPTDGQASYWQSPNPDTLDRPRARVYSLPHLGNNGSIFMSKQLPPGERELFRTAVDGAEPLTHDRAEPYRRRPRPVPISQPPDLAEQDAPPGLSEAEVVTEEFLLFARPGLQKRVVYDLQRGHIDVDIEVDLHGLTVAVAQRVLTQFLAECAQTRVRCARIIHGKGFRSAEQQPVLKCKLNYWLRLRPEVLAFCSATRRDGGTGAVYVLLRNPDKQARARS
jgi:DNA-nicking Smr family endonuclease